MTTWGTSKLEMDDYVQLQNLFLISPALKQAYEFKQAFEHVAESTDRKQAAYRLSKWIIDVQASDLEEFKKVAATYQRWGREILNSFDHPYTNGFTEGCNNINRALLTEPQSRRSFVDIKKKEYLTILFLFYGTPSGVRTPDTLIKSQVLYQLS